MSAVYTPAAAKLSLKCKICGRAAARGSKLCGECGAAVKRARQVPTVMSQFMPVALSGYGSATSSLAHHQTVRFRNAPPPRPSSAMPISWGAFFAFVAFVAAVCVTAYFAALEIGDGPGPAAMVEPAVDAAPAARVDTAPLPSAAAAENGEPTPVDDHRQAGTGPPSSPAPARASSRRPTAMSGTAGYVSPTIPAGLSMTAADSNADSNPSEGAGAPLPPATAAVPQEPIVPDRWQAMQDAIAACTRDNFFAGVVCEQRVRLRYCDGYWGNDPHCGSGMRFDGGR